MRIITVIFAIAVAMLSLAAAPPPKPEHAFTFNPLEPLFFTFDPLGCLFANLPIRKLKPVW
jgi:hypothetical protein